ARHREEHEATDGEARAIAIEENARGKLGQHEGEEEGSRHGPIGRGRQPQVGHDRGGKYRVCGSIKLADRCGQAEHAKDKEALWDHECGIMNCPGRRLSEGAEEQMCRVLLSVPKERARAIANRSPGPRQLKKGSAASSGDVATSAEASESALLKRDDDTAANLASENFLGQFRDLRQGRDLG